MPKITEKKELLFARISVAFAICIAGWFGINPPAYVAQVVAFAFGLAASTLFPVLVMGIFSKRLNKEGAIVGMLAGLIFTASYIAYFKLIFPEFNNSFTILLPKNPAPPVTKILFKYNHLCYHIKYW